MSWCTTFFWNTVYLLTGSPLIASQSRPCNYPAGFFVHSIFVDYATHYKCKPGDANSAFYPSEVGTGNLVNRPAWLGLRRGAFACVGWQVTPCDPVWQVTLRSSDDERPGRLLFVVGHLHGGSAKDVSVTLCADKPLTLTQHELRCRVVRIVYDRPSADVADWDDRLKTVRWISSAADT